nr:MAG TPA: hypothetical protein [Caudoviricetes sp.]
MHKIKPIVLVPIDFMIFFYIVSIYYTFSSLHK